MNNKSHKLILVFTFLFLFGSSPVYADDFKDGLNARDRGDYKTAIEKLKPLAEQGDALAQYNLGLMYYIGLGVTLDLKEAVKWYRLAAEQGHARAQDILGMMYDRGQGVPQDYKEAVKWYRLAAEQGIGSSQHNLGLMYTKGRGVPQDYVSAHMWFNIAGSNGDKGAVDYRDIFEKRMTPQQIEKAQEMARNWKPKTK
jgi:uncharacterized protein